MLAAGAGYWLIVTPFGPPEGTSDAQAVFVEITPGMGTQGIATQLERAGVIRNRYGFELLRILHLRGGGSLKAGEYRFNHPAPATEVYDRIARGDVYTIALTIPEGYNIFDIAQAVEAAGLGKRDAFLEAERSQKELVADLSPNAASLEGFLFPDTYRFQRKATPVQILSAMVRRFRQVAAQIGLGNGGEGSVGHTVLMASLVEKEVSVDAERPLVAGVFRNRLAQGIPLATDPTVIYAALLAGQWRGTIYASDLKFDSPYNTYRHAGLPPGPICNPGIAALKAAMSPAKTDYLYFVADAQGHSRFASSLEEHSRNVQAYRKATGEAPEPPPAAKPKAKATHASHR